jgi:hypothetical protein
MTPRNHTLLVVLLFAAACATASAAAHSTKPKEIVVVSSKVPARPAANFRKLGGLATDVSHIEHAVYVKKVGGLDVSK